MRQVTGRTNPQQNKKQVSIRISGGHSFSVPAGADQKCAEVVEWLTPHTVVVPKELFCEEEAAACLALQGYTIPEGCRVVWSTATEPIVAVMAVAEEVLAMLPSTVQHTTPLLHMPTVLQPTVWICDAGDLIYIKVYDPALQFAEVIAVEGEADRAYLIERLAERIDTERFLLMLDDRAKQISLYKRHFNKVICE